MLSGAAGYTYGANGIWQVNRRGAPYGASPHGATWGNTPWDDACRLPGSGQVGLAASILRRFEWWRFEPHPEWVTPAGSAEAVRAPFAAGIPGVVRVIYLFDPVWPWAAPRPAVCGLETGAAYRARFIDPRSGAEHDLGAVEADASGAWPIPVQPELTDWVLVLAAERGF
jgi:hypothetical protein